ncbi:HDOD domain-containing protein [Pseudomonas sp. Gutcm_11s]|uniref:HDOD domain-containing protein n=1 Tax=Pseudomonas sp. Gutcm_11s TaxID=3026088 RepID=UPI00235E1D97|nr:HDOD domain-containing protein [Pseudomonas sp. Gutcm_11s]MDD0842950.1 HDOD domain-containing protein [Pseudomonas sp. Gutcm_11s]
MPTTKNLPRSIDAWLKQLDEVRLPIAGHHHEAIRRVLLDSRRSLRDIAERMQDSPAVALAVLREANRNTGGLSEPAESLEMALNRLGLKRAETLLGQMTVLDEAQIPLALCQLQLISLHASQQANGLFAGRLARLWQEIHWGSLLFLAPLWPLAASQPELFEAWERRVLGRGEPAGKVERELLGVSLNALCLALARHWRLPEWIVQGYRLLVEDRRLLVKALHIARDNEHTLHQQQVLDEDSNLRRWLTQPGNSILLANGLALSSHHNWSCQHHLRWQRLAGLYLQTELPDLQQLIHQQAALSARQHAQPGLWHPAEALLWPWEACRLKDLQAPAAPKINTQLDLWKQHCAQLLAQPSPFANVLQLTDSACQALQAGGMQRVLVLLADRTHSRLMAQQVAGLPDAAAQLRLDPTQSQVLRRLLAEPGQLRLSPANLAQVSALLPGSLKALFNGEHLILRSLASNGRVVMLLVADQGGGDIGATPLQIFGKTVQCIERALATFARRGA